MTKAELVEGVAHTTELSKRDAEQLVEIALACVVEALNRGEKVELRCFGSFRVREREARRGRNPKSGAAVAIPAKRVPYFKAGKQLREVINGWSYRNPVPTKASGFSTLNVTVKVPLHWII